MGRKYKTPAENTHICHCLMENGHGAVTVGSEIGAGVKNMLVEKCYFSHTDRGLRIKTRRLKAVLRKRIHEVPPGADQGKKGL